MKNIEEFLQKFKLIPNPLNYKKDISSVIESVTKIKIEVENIKIQGRNLILKVNPAVKNIIFIKKDQILKEIEVKIPDRKIDAII